MSGIRQIRARVHVLTAKEGGRKAPLYSGYRAGFFIGKDPTAGNDGVMTLENDDRCAPGEDCTVRIEFMHPELVPPHLRPNAFFELKEGGRVVGTGTVLEVEG